MYKNRLLFSLLLVAGLGQMLLFAGGTKEDTRQTVTGLNNWQNRYDITDKQPGQYNILIEGRDSAGNIAIAGPFNVWVDPASDIPVVSINNPLLNMRVGTNLNVVGTCVDDDAVDYVEVQLDDGEFKRATGSQYWSFYLPVKDIPDGKHKITVRGYDIKGIESKHQSVEFNIDKLKPEAGIGSHTNGMLVSGWVDLKGTAVDANGLSKAEISTDSGKTFSPLYLNPDQAQTSATFNYGLDTKKFADGPLVVWFRSKDQTGSVGLTAFLLFIDNTKPEIRILSPQSTDPMNGIVSISGSAKDAIGIKELSWEFGQKKGTVPLVAGNPWFVVPFDCSAITEPFTSVLFRATDTIGNVTELRYALKLDREADLPVLELPELANKALVEETIRTVVHIRDDDGAKAVRYTVDNQAEQVQEIAESGVLVISGLSGGEHRIVLRAEDLFGTLGKAIERTVQVRFPAPVVSFEKFSIGTSPTGYRIDPISGAASVQAVSGTASAESLDFVGGLEILQDAQNVVSGSFSAFAGLDKAEYSIAGGEWKNLSWKGTNKPGANTFDLSLPQDLPFGIVTIAIRVKDKQGQEAQASNYLRVRDYRNINTEPGVVFRDNRIGDDGLVQLGGKALIGAFVGATPASVRIQPSSPLVSVELIGSRIVVTGVKEGTSNPVKIVVTTKEKHQFSSAEMRFSTDVLPPQITLESAKDGTRIKTNFVLTAGIKDDGMLSDAAWSRDNGATWNDLQIAAEKPGAQVKKTLDLADQPDGAFILMVRARDKAGNEARARVSLVKDAVAPAISIDNTNLSPAGRLVVWGRISDTDTVERFEYRVGAGAWQKGTIQSRFVLSIDTGSQNAVDLSLRAADRAANEATETRKVEISALPTPAPTTDESGKALQAPRPTARILSADGGATLYGKFDLVFLVENWSPVYKRYSIQLDGQKANDTADIPETGLLVLPLDLTQVRNSGNSNLTVVLEGDNRERENISLKLNVDPKLDHARVSFLSADDALREYAVFAQDENGVASIKYTVDGKNEASIDGTEIGMINLASLEPGKHTLAVWAVDNQGVVSARQEKQIVFTAGILGLTTAGIGTKDAETEFQPGVAVELNRESRLILNLAEAGNLKELNYRLNSAQNQNLNVRVEGSTGRLELPLSNTLPWGLNTIDIAGTDKDGRTIAYKTFFFRVAPASAAGTVEVPGIQLDLSLEGGIVRLPADTPLRGSFTGRPIAAVSLEPPQSEYEIAFTGNVFTIKALRPTVGVASRIVVKDQDGDIFKSAELRVQYDPDGPVVALQEPSNGSWLSKKILIKGSVSDSLGVESLEYQLRGIPLQTAETVAAPEAPPAFGAPTTPAEPKMVELGPFAKIPLVARAKEIGTYDFSIEADLSGLADGTVSLELRSRDTFGRVSTELRAISHDQTAAEVLQIGPTPEDMVNGLTTLSGRIAEKGKMKSLEFSADNKAWIPVELTDIFHQDVDFSSYPTLPEKFFFRTTDAAGNIGIFNPKLAIDQEGDRPVVRIQIPEENEVLRSDFKVSGIALDDDGIAAIYYRLDHKAATKAAPSAATPASASTPAKPVLPAARTAPAVAGARAATGAATTTTTIQPRVEDKAAAEKAVRDANRVALKSELGTFVKLEGANNFDIALKMLEVGDNEHKIEMVAEDIYGNLGDMVTSTFRISTAEPTSEMNLPVNGTTIREKTKLSGTAADANGIESVWLSFDNSNSFVKANGTEAWDYELDTTTLRDGTHSLTIKTTDKYSTDGLYATLIAIDNTAPVLSLAAPPDGAEVIGILALSGRIDDNIGLSSVHLSMVPADSPMTKKTDQIELDLEKKTVVQQSIDISKLSPGWYTLRIEAKDFANNIGWISRNVQVVSQKRVASVDLIFPLEGESVSGSFTVSGKIASSLALPKTVRIVLNATVLGEFPVNTAGWFNVPLKHDQVPEGVVIIGASIGEANAESGSARTESAPRTISFQKNGPWMQFDTIQTGDYLTKRPYVTGLSGWNQPEVAQDSPDYPAYQKELEQHRVEKVQVSLDHGISWSDVQGASSWRYRVETQNFPDGELFLLVRSRFVDGSTTVGRAIMVVDKTAPTIGVLKPGEEGRFNEYIDIIGIASDNFGLQDIKVDLRQGDKASYKVPSFIQGLYLDANFLGSTIWSAGFGLTFFDDNVKLQANLGKAPTGDRFDGYMFGVKLIANIATLPFSFLFGPDMDFFSMSLSVGAQFDYFTMNGDSFDFSGTGVVLGSALVQWEYARFHFADFAVFRTISLYSEGQLWFISSDVEAGVGVRLAFGVRTSIF